MKPWRSALPMRAASILVIVIACHDAPPPTDPAAEAAMNASPTAEDAVSTAFRQQAERVTEQYRNALDDSGILEKYALLIGATTDVGAPATGLAGLMRLLRDDPDLYTEFIGEVSAVLETARLNAVAELDRLALRYEAVPFLRPDPAATEPDQRDMLEETLARFRPGDYVVSGEPSDVLAADATEPIASTPLDWHSLKTYGPRSPGADLANLSSFRTCIGKTAPCIWPIVFDLYPHGMEILWATGFTQQELEEIVQEDGWSLFLFVNGHSLVKGPPSGGPGSLTQYYAATVPGEPCPANRQCIATNIFVRKALRDIPQPWTIELRILKLKELETPFIIGIDEFGNPIAVTHEAALAAWDTKVVQANPTAGKSWFTALLYPTFQHPRCADCHGFGNFEALAAHHGSSVEYFVPQTQLHLEPSAYVQGGHVMACANCHEVPLADGFGRPFHETEWIAPYQDLDVDWATKTPAQTCARVKSNLPTQQLRYQHFHGDGRLFWAIQKPFIPGEGTLEDAPPDVDNDPFAPLDFEEFLRRIDLWNMFEAPCP